MQDGTGRTFLFRVFQRILGLFFLLAVFPCHALPVPDNSFGSGGQVRVGAPSGFEDTAWASAQQADGKLLVAGVSAGRQTQIFVLRYGRSGVLDGTFASAGVLTLPSPAAYFGLHPVQLEALADGSTLLLVAFHKGFMLVRITPAGQLDGLFGNAGVVVLADEGVVESSYGRYALRLAVQADGRLLVVSDASGNGSFSLRLRRLLANGASDTSFGTNGERLLSDLSSGVTFLSTDLAYATPEGGMVLAALPAPAKRSYLLLRLNANGGLDSTFGKNGIVSGYDLGAPDDWPTQMVRTPDGQSVLLGTTIGGIGAMPVVLWQVNAQGLLNTAFGSGGRRQINTAASINSYYFRLGVLPDGSLVSSESSASFSGGALALSRFAANGSPLVSFGSNGSVVTKATGYANSHPLGFYTDGAGGFTLVSWAARTEICGFICSFVSYSGVDVALLGFAADGQLRQGFGNAGLVVWNNPALSNDRVDAVRVDASGRLQLAGLSDGNGKNIYGDGDYFAARFLGDGSVDSTYATNGRLYPGKWPLFSGLVRAVLQPDGALVVASGVGKPLSRTVVVGRAAVFRADLAGKLDVAFKPDLVSPATDNADVALGVRSDGRLLYATTPSRDKSSQNLVLQQLMPDGSPDQDFGTAGTVLLPLAAGDPSMQADLVVLADGSVVVAVLTTQDLRLFKLDARGVPVASFGSAGVFIYPGDFSEAYTVGRGLTLLALADGSYFAAIDMFSSAVTPPNCLQTVRVSGAGSLVRSSRLLGDSAYLDAQFVALPDGSVLLARTRRDSSSGLSDASLLRLLPDDTFDASFGAGGAYPLPGMSRASALALDNSGRLLVAGQDAESAVLRRYTLNVEASSVPVVEYYNVNLGHYFVTAGQGEMNAIDSGAAGPGWQRTGLGFRAYIPESGVAAGALPVCRFYGTPGVGPNSHFYTVDAGECDSVKQDRGWTNEGMAFFIPAPQGGNCPSGLQPVYRAYNNRYAQNDSNHRYSTDLSRLQAMQAKGWSLENAVFCAPGS